MRLLQTDKLAVPNCVQTHRFLNLKNYIATFWMQNDVAINHQNLVVGSPPPTDS